MDRSSLSDPAVVQAARDFICVRLATYESRTEAEFLETVFRGRSGKLENTVFALFAPDGKTRLTRGGRSPEMVFRGGAPEMLGAMQRALARYPGTRADRALPVVKGVRLGLNVAACDGCPLVIAPKRLEAQVARAAWSAEFAGRFVYAVARDAAELAAIPGANAGQVVVAAPDAYGQKGRVLGQTADAAALTETFRRALRGFTKKTKDPRRHIGAGRRQGIHWETEIPVTDPGRPPPRGR